MSIHSTVRSLECSCDVLWRHQLHLPSCELTLAGQRGGGHFTSNGFLAVPPEAFAIELKIDKIDGEIKFGMTDLPFNLDIIDFFSFSGQVRSLTYNVISKPSQITTSRNFAMMPISGNLSQEDETFRE